MHDIESQFFGTSLGIDLNDAFPVEEGHVHHLRTVNRIRAAGGIRAAIDSGLLRGGIMYEAYAKNIPVVLCGSIRDDGPLPDVITDVVECAARDARVRAGDRHGADGVHALALDRRRQSAAREVKTICVDINPASVTKLTDRGTHQSLGIVMDASSFLRELSLALRALAPA